MEINRKENCIRNELAVWLNDVIFFHWNKESRRLVLYVLRLTFPTWTFEIGSGYLFQMCYKS